MKLKLKEDPNEWRKFTAVWCVVIPLVIGLLARKGIVPLPFFWGAASVAVVAMVLSFLAPHLFRGFYRAGMTGSFYLGQFMGKIILSLVYWLTVVPMSCLVRLMGKDLLETKASKHKSSYWKDARRTGTFEQQF